MPSSHPLGERLSYIEAVIAESIPQRTRMIEQLDRIEQNQALQLALSGRVKHLEERQSVQEEQLDDLIARKHKALGAATLLGVAGGAITTWFAKKFPLF